MPFAVISTRREHALLMKIHQQPEFPFCRLELRFELALVILIDGPVRRPEFAFHLLV